MQVIQLVSGLASRYARKCADIDRASRPADVRTRIFVRMGRTVDEQGVATTMSRAAGAALVQVYGTQTVPPGLLRRIATPWIADAEAPRPTLPWRRPSVPAAIETPLRVDETMEGWVELPEAVDSCYLQAEHAARPARAPGVVGTIRRPGTPSELLDAIRARVERFRDDIEWAAFDDYPTPDEMAKLDAWIDTATAIDDFDGGVAEAVCCGVPVVAARLPINRLRLDDGAAGLLVPPGDANEFVHALLGALFKPEIASARLERARACAARFDPARRAAALGALYESILV